MIHFYLTLLTLVTCKWFIQFEHDLQDAINAARREISFNTSATDKVCYSSLNGLQTPNVKQVVNNCADKHNRTSDLSTTLTCPIIGPEDICIHSLSDGCSLEIYPGLRDLSVTKHFPIRNQSEPVMALIASRIWIGDSCNANGCLYYSIDNVWLRHLLAKSCPTSTCSILSASREILLSTTSNCTLDAKRQYVDSDPIRDESRLHQMSNYSRTFLMSESNSTTFHDKCLPATILPANEYYDHFCAEKECNQKSTKACPLYQSCMICNGKCRTHSWCQVFANPSTKTKTSSAAIIVCIVIFVILFLMGVASCQRRLTDQSSSPNSPRESCSIEEEISDDVPIVHKPIIPSPSQVRSVNKQSYNNTESSGYSSTTQIESDPKHKKHKSKSAGVLIRTHVQVHRPPFRVSESESLINL